jgi:predicted ATPase
VLTSLHIQGFRGFADYRIERLARVNLLVGANNSGKTSVLEATETLLGHGQIPVVINGPLRREEGVFDRHNDPEVLELNHLFFGRPATLPTTFSISGTNGSLQQVEVTLGMNPEEDTDVAVRRNRRQRTLNDEATAVVLTTRFRASPEADFTEVKASIDELVQFLNHMRMSQVVTGRLDAPHRHPSVNFMPTSGLTSRSLAERWNTLALTPQEDLVIEALKMIEPRVERVAFLQDPQKTPRIVLKLQGSSARVPLGSMGEGMRRILALAIGLGTSADGCFLTDEIDTGLHYTAMQRMWKLVVESANRLNVQVLATTHSLDCIRAFAAFAEDSPEHGADVLVHRIEPQRDRAITFTAEEVCAAVAEDSELRGWLK